MKTVGFDGAAMAPRLQQGIGLPLAFQASMRRLAIVKRESGGDFS